MMKQTGRDNGLRGDGEGAGVSEKGQLDRSCLEQSVIVRQGELG